jgi:actin-related protein
MVTNDQ